MSAYEIDPLKLRRVAIIGTSCTGKTTLARKLSQLLQAPHIELDALYWLPNWQERSTKEFCALTASAIESDRWVTDGNYGVIRDALWARATTLIWLDYSFPLTAYRALSRTIRRIITRETLYANNRETFQKSFLSRNSILLWVLKTHQSKRRRYPQLLQQPQNSHLQIIILRSPREADQFLKNLEID